jgi:RNA polymerase sigma-70 factor (ECF subfamily)
MSRPSVCPGEGLSALRAAVADVRRQELARSARAALVAGERGVAFRVASPARGSTATAVEAVVPTQAAPGDDEIADIAPPEGDTAVTHALVERAQAGDAEAFGELYDRYVDLVYRYIYYRVGTPQLAEDLTSETFLRALRRISSFTWQGRDVGAWFVTIARNLIADHYKSGRYRLEMTTDDIVETGSKLVEDGPESAVLESMQNKVLLEAVKQLNAEQQECIVLRFLQGLSVAETAQAMGKNDGAIKALQYRAIRSLGRLLPEGVEL